VAAGRWTGGFFQRLIGLVKTQSKARDVLARLRVQGLREGLSPDQLENLQCLARQAYRTALLSAHYEDLRGLLASWRYFHRWVALLMVLLAAVHVAVALRYGRVVP
jgi:hypothetical protein